MKAGVLALQGAFREHREALDALGVESVEVRTPEELASVDALILPGGESTAVAKLLVTSGLDSSLRDRLGHGFPVFGTCAGLILLATTVLDGRPGRARSRSDQASLGALDVVVRRNAYGTQLQSFEAPLDVHGLAGGPFTGVFIRSPMIESVGDGVEVLSVHRGHPVLVRCGPVWASTFHPELSGDLRVHQAFLGAAFPGQAFPGHQSLQEATA
jgi:5'-phosphate synthase pdxT subunit